MGTRSLAWARPWPADPIDEEYRPFPDVARRNAWQERIEVPALVRALALPRGRRVLEVGCGRGVALPVLATALRPSRLAGLDLDGTLLAEAATRLRLAGREAELFAADVRDMPFPARSFDVVVDFGTCYHVARREAALREIARVLAPGGLFVHETRISQFLSHPLRARGRGLPWEAAPDLVPARHAQLWAARVKAAERPRSRLTAVVLAGALLGAAPGARAQEARPVPAAESVAPAPAPSPAPGPTRLFFAPTARSFGAGQGAAGLTEIAFPWLEAGLGHGASVLVVGLPPLEDLVSGGIVVGPKLHLASRGRFHLATGVLHALQAHQSLGVAYGVVTVGGAKGGATAGLGYGYGDWDDGHGGRPVAWLGLDRALTPSIGVTLEAWIGGRALGLPDQTLIGALRLGRHRWSMDLGVVMPVYETGSGTPFPLLTVSGRF